MRKITGNMLHAIRHGKAWHGDNTAVTRTLPHDDVQGVRVALHGNPIAFIPDDESLPIKITLAGWDTMTTRDRVHAIAWEFAGCRVGRVKGETTVTFPQQPHTSGPAAYRPRPTEWVTIERKHVLARREVA